MTKVQRARPHDARDRQRSVRKKKDFKIVLEAVTEQKRKLHTVATYVDRPPKDYGFVPVGFGDFTDWCKEQCRQRGRDVHIVSAAPHNRTHVDPNKLSSHVHRIGYHFPLDVIEPACKLLGYKYSSTGGVEKLPDGPTYGDAYFERRFADYYEKTRSSLHGRPGVIDENKEYISGAIREMFPKIPEADLESIVNHAFESGTKRVGNAKELTLARRVQLAVLAHIRHQYTEYDNILKTGSWTEARKAVEQNSVAKLIEWRDEQGGTTEELEEVFREVIVIDDDDDDKSSDDGQPQDPDVDEREVSMDVVSSLATARDLLPMPVDHSQRHVPDQHRSTRRTIYLPSRPVAPYPPTGSSPLVYNPPHGSRTDPRGSSRPMPEYVESRRVMHVRPLDPRMMEPVRVPRPLEMRGSDGQLYTLRPIEPQSDVQPKHIEAPLVSYRSQPSSPSHHTREPLRRYPHVEYGPNSRPRLTPASRRASDQDVVIPSIEQESTRAPSPRLALEAHYQYRHDRNHGYVSHADDQLSKRKSFPGSSSAYRFDELSQEPYPKRSRPVYDERRHSGHVIDQSNATHRSMFGPVTTNHRPQPQQHELTSGLERASHVVEGTSSRTVPLQGAGGAYDQYISVPRTSFPLSSRGVHYEPARDSHSGMHAPAYVYSGRRPEHIPHEAFGPSRLQSGADPHSRNSSVYEIYRKL